MRASSLVSFRFFCARALGCFLFLICCCPLFAQTNNSWISATSGNWEDINSWSLGIMPGTNQNIFLTNAGWKAVAIGPNTTQNDPQSMNVLSLTITSPTNTENTLLMNFSGQNSPLVLGNPGGYPGPAGTLVVGSNSSFVMLSAALNVVSTTFPGGNGVISLGGTFTEDYGSHVSTGQLNIGDTGPAFFGLTNSFVSASDESVGGNFPAQFLHYSGTNYSTFNLDMRNGGEYDIYNGYLQTPISFDGGNFYQWGGLVSADVSYGSSGGTYHLNGGTALLNGLAVPAISTPSPAPPPGPVGSSSNSFFLQTGGTNIAYELSLGGDQYGLANYTLSGGYLSTPSGLSVANFTNSNSNVFATTFNQSGGVHSNQSLTVTGSYDNRFIITSSSYNLSGGVLDTGSIDVDMGLFTQSGGTNNAPSIVLNDVGNFNFSGGRLNAQTIQLNGGQLSGQIGAFTQSGGTSVVGDISLNSRATFAFTGGELVVTTIEVTETSTFVHGNGILLVTRMLTLNEGTWNEQGKGQQLTQLQLSGGGDSIISFPAGACKIGFADSSSLAWSNNASLTVQNWKGSLLGGGSQQIGFGSSSSALTPQQVNQIEFLNPAGLPSGIYPARILSNGELVPNALRPVLGLSPSGGNAVQINLLGPPSQTYEIDISSNLVTWTELTNLTSTSNGTYSFTAALATNIPARFYRALIKP